MSMPGWQDSHARDSQNGEVIGPLTGQMSPPEPGRTGPSAGAPAVDASFAWILRCWLRRLAPPRGARPVRAARPRRVPRGRARAGLRGGDQPLLLGAVAGEPVALVDEAE